MLLDYSIILSTLIEFRNFFVGYRTRMKFESRRQYVTSVTRVKHSAIISKLNMIQTFWNNIKPYIPPKNVQNLLVRSGKVQNSSRLFVGMDKERMMPKEIAQDNSILLVKSQKSFLLKDSIMNRLLQSEHNNTNIPQTGDAKYRNKKQLVRRSSAVSYKLGDKYRNLSQNSTYRCKSYSLFSKKETCVLPIKCKLKCNEDGQMIAEPYAVAEPTCQLPRMITKDLTCAHEDEIGKLSGDIEPFEHAACQQLITKCSHPTDPPIRRANALTEYLHSHKQSPKVIRTCQIPKKAKSEDHPPKQRCANCIVNARICEPPNTQRNIPKGDPHKKGISMTLDKSNLLSELKKNKAIKFSGFIEPSLIKALLCKLRLGWTPKHFCGDADIRKCCSCSTLMGSKPLQLNFKFDKGNESIKQAHGGIEIDKIYQNDIFETLGSPPTNNSVHDCRESPNLHEQGTNTDAVRVGDFKLLTREDRGTSTKAKVRGKKDSYITLIGNEDEQNKIVETFEDPCKILSANFFGIESENSMTYNLTPLNSRFPSSVASKFSAINKISPAGSKLRLTTSNLDATDSSKFDCPSSMTFIRENIVPGSAQSEISNTELLVWENTDTSPLSSTRRSTKSPLKLPRKDSKNRKKSPAKTSKCSRLDQTCRTNKFNINSVSGENSPTPTIDCNNTRRNYSPVKNHDSIINKSNDSSVKTNDADCAKTQNQPAVISVTMGKRHLSRIPSTTTILKSPSILQDPFKSQANQVVYKVIGSAPVPIYLYKNSIHPKNKMPNDSKMLSTQKVISPVPPTKRPNKSSLKLTVPTKCEYLHRLFEKLSPPGSAKSSKRAASTSRGPNSGDSYKSKKGFSSASSGGADKGITKSKSDNEMDCPEVFRGKDKSKVMRRGTIKPRKPELAPSKAKPSAKGLDNPSKQRPRSLDAMKSRTMNPLFREEGNAKSGRASSTPHTKPVISSPCLSLEAIAATLFRDVHVMQSRYKSDKCSPRDKRPCPHKEKDYNAKGRKEFYEQRDYDAQISKDLARMLNTRDCDFQKLDGCPITNDDLRRGRYSTSPPTHASGINRCNLEQCSKSKSKCDEKRKMKSGERRSSSSGKGQDSCNRPPEPPKCGTPLVFQEPCRKREPKSDPCESPAKESLCDPPPNVQVTDTCKKAEIKCEPPMKVEVSDACKKAEPKRDPAPKCDPPPKCNPPPKCDPPQKVVAVPCKKPSEPKCEPVNIKVVTFKKQECKRNEQAKIPDPYKDLCSKRPESAAACRTTSPLYKSPRLDRQLPKVPVQSKKFLKASATLCSNISKGLGSQVSKSRSSKCKSTTALGGSRKSGGTTCKKQETCHTPSKEQDC